MSAAVPFVFISACTRDLQQARLVLRDALLSLGCHPVLQDHFEVTPGEPIVAKLRRKLETCDYVIHLAGIARVAPIISGYEGETEAHWSLDHPLMREFVLHQRSPHRPLADSLYPAWRDAWLAFLEACFDAKIIPGGWQRYERLVPLFVSLP